MTPQKPLGIGLISVGWMGKVHTKAYRELPSVYPELGVAPRLVQAADTSEERVQYAQEVLGYESGTTDYHEVLANPDVDVVSICAPNFLHREMGIAAAKAGKPFWIEKPAGRSGDETADIAQAAAEAGVLTSVGFNYRNAPALEHAKKSSPKENSGESPMYAESSLQTTQPTPRAPSPGDLSATRPVAASSATSWATS